jgi:hypothetical protein
MEPRVDTQPYKAVYAFVLATLTAASGIWLDNPWLTLALAGVTAVGTYFVPNPPKHTSV